MKKKLLTLVLALVMTSTCTILAQSILTTVQVTAAVQSNPAQIVLHWTSQPNSSAFLIYRKTPGSGSWGVAQATVAGTANSYTDNSVSTGVLYEYKIQRNTGVFTGGASWGYITSGIDIPETANRGTIIVVIESSVYSSVSAGIKQYISDLEGEGWFVRQFQVDRTTPVAKVKSEILSYYDLSPASTKAVVLIGHVPVPYSGNFAPDGHSYQAVGYHDAAWPADMYYADLDGTWTDVAVNFTLSSYPANQNIPGDGKFDQSYVPNNANNTAGTIELEIGRIDMYDLPSFTSKTETQLLQDYFDRNHNYRTKTTAYTTRALVDDNFGAYAEGAWLLSPLVGADNIVAADYFSSLGSSSYLWSYGCGGGSPTSAGGVGSTSDFAATPVQTAFTMLFGSWFGDWNFQDNFMRASLASGALTCVWSGRPNWFFHPMGMDATIGSCNMLSQNNMSFLYTPGGSFAGGVHAALLGDPTLRNQVIAPPTSITCSINPSGETVLGWGSSSEFGKIAYNIYRIYTGASGQTAYTKIATVTTNTFATCDNTNETVKYIVRAVRKVTSPSGSFYLESTGVQISPDNVLNPQPIVTTDGDTVRFANNSTGPATAFGYNYDYTWNLWNGSEINAYAPAPIPYNSVSVRNPTVTLTMTHGCRSASKTVTWSFIDSARPGSTVTSPTTQNNGEIPVSVFPNPSAEGVFNVSLGTVQGVCNYKIMDVMGRVIRQGKLSQDAKNAIDLSAQSNGIYYILVHSEQNKQITFKLIKN